MKRLKRIFPTREELAADKWKCLVVIISGIVLRFAFPKFDLWWLVWIVPVPFFYFLFNLPPRSSFWLGWAFGFSFYYSTIFWLNTLVIYNPFTIPGIFLMGLAMGLFIAFFSLLNSHFERRLPALRYLYTPGLWVIFEYLRSLGPVGFSWAYLAHTHYRQLHFIQIADITGVYGISFLIVLGNIVLARILGFCLSLIGITSKAMRKCPVLPIFIFLILTGGNLWYGKLALAKYTSSKSPSLSISIVQTNVPQPLKLASYISPDENERKKLQLHLLQNLTNLVLTLKDKSSLIICPETTITDPFFSVNRPLQEYVQKLSQAVNTPILFGADEVVLSTDGNNMERIYNSAWLVEPDKGLSKTVYRKIHLVPFGEYVPLGGIIPFLEAIVQIGNFDAGTESTIFRLNLKKMPDEVKTWRLGVMICFESSFSYLARRLVERGGNFLVVITNDAWYGRSSGAYQHYALAVFRAIEFRRPVLRSANTGISAIINANGAILDSLPLETEGVMTNDCYREDNITFYCAYGEFFAYCIIMCIVLLWLIARAKTKNGWKIKVVVR